MAECVFAIVHNAGKITAYTELLLASQKNLLVLPKVKIFLGTSLLPKSAEVFARNADRQFFGNTMVVRTRMSLPV